MSGTCEQVTMGETGFDIMRIAASLLMIAWLLRIGIGDFLTHRIRNADVLVLVGLFLLWSATGLFHGLEMHLMSGAVLFVIGYAFWFLRLMGGGDAKLFFPAGLLVGWQGLGLFALALLGFSVLALLVVKSGIGASGTGRIGQRLRVIRDSGKVPYGVPIVLAVIVATDFW
ncbi:prepilin peptidase [Aliiroseovarius crassostreae]|uniref:prepilin peptidase n=1 Tax=Aliiroseovarius crassostreae TaxID=154981 RepID=UPI0021AF18E9|nr:prepilin peptidase [Aliiroseovarius crassostreae]UWQ09879.1 prepilin peptidase [Aliiroseovarius crassostreae]